MSDQPRLAFVIGGRRTGTTMTGAILCSDPAANPVVPEVRVLTRLLEARRVAVQDHERFGRPFFSDRSDAAGFLDPVARGFVDRMTLEFPDARTIVLKNPEMSKVALEAADVFPEAQFVVCVRDPRDQVASEIEVGNRRLSQGGRGEAVSARRVKRLVRTYLSFYEEIHELSARRPDAVTVVRYEDIVTGLEAPLDAMRRATGLALKEVDLDQGWRVHESVDLESREPWRTERYGRGIDSSAVGRYANDLSGPESAEVVSEAAGFMSRYGYR